MDIILKRSGGQNVVLRPQARATWYPPAHGEAVEVEIFRRELDADGRFVGAAVSLGRFPSTGKLSIPNNPVTDKNLLFYLVSYSADGTPDVSSLEDAVQVSVPFKRETDAPAVTQVGAATNTLVELAVEGFSRFAAKRKVRTSPAANMSGATETVTDYTGQEVPRIATIERAEAPGSLTIYVAISHSAGVTYGPESVPLAVTFATSGGTGGSTGGGGYWKQDPYGL